MFGITPDLSTFGKSMGNGFPISAVVGRADIMREMEDIFFSFTFGGEGVSLAASIAVIEKMEREPVIETLWTFGQQLIDQTNTLISKFNLGQTVKVIGKPCWSLLQISDSGKYTSWQLKTLFLQEVLSQGVLTGGSNNVCYAHTCDDIAIVESAYRAAFGAIRDVLNGSPLESHLRSAAIKPIFRVRG